MLHIIDTLSDTVMVNSNMNQFSTAFITASTVSNKLKLELS